MCGIVALIRFDEKPAGRSLLKRFQKQKTRGIQGFGFVTVDNTSKISKYTRAANQEDIEKLVKENNDSLMVFHHRTPTSTPNVLESAHPIKVSHPDFKHDYYVVHNGIISNADELLEEHVARGFSYNTYVQHKMFTSGQTYLGDIEFNDSEAFAIDLARVIEGQKDAIDAEGSIAFVALQVNKESGICTDMYFGRNARNPLMFEKTKHFLCLRSEGGSESVIEDHLYKYNLVTGMTKTPLKIGVNWTYTPKAKVGFDVSDRDYDYDYYSHRNRTIGDVLSDKKLPLLPKKDAETTYLEDEEITLMHEKIHFEGVLKRAIEEGNYENEMDARADLDLVLEELTEIRSQLNV